MKKFLPLLCLLLFACEKESTNLDTDGDGINNTADQCPNTAGVAAHNGCPAHTLTISIEGQGSITQNGKETSASTTYKAGEKVSLKAVAASSWQFKEWKGDLSGLTNPVEITMEGTKNITAVFTQASSAQEGFDQPTVSKAKIAVIPIDFKDTPEQHRQKFPSKAAITAQLEAAVLKQYFKDVSYDLFSLEFTVLDYYRLPFDGVTDGKIFNTDQLAQHPYTLPNFAPEDYDHLLFVPVHDWQLGGARAGNWALQINGVSYEIGKLSSLMVPIFVGHYQRDTAGQPFRNSTSYKNGYAIPTGPESGFEGEVPYPFSNFQQTFIHELIHALGIGTHARSRTNGNKYDYETEIANNADLYNQDYGDKFCVMGFGEYALSLNAVYRDFLGWHNTTVRQRVVAKGKKNIKLYPINTKDKTAFVEIRIPGLVNEFSWDGYKNEGYFLEVRDTADPWSNFIAHNALQENLNGVFIRKTDGYTSWLLDASPTDNINFYGQAVSDLRDVVLKPAGIYENQWVKISVLSKNQDGSFNVEVTIK